MSETWIPCKDTAGSACNIVIEPNTWYGAAWILDVDERRGRGRCLLTDEQFDQLALANPRVKALLDAALDSLATGVIAAGLDDAVAPFVVALGGETGGTGDGK